ncbi:MAG: hypothetical protein ABI150_13185 [Nitrobacter sp.]
MRLGLAHGFRSMNCLRLAAAPDVVSHHRRATGFIVTLIVFDMIPHRCTACRTPNPRRRCSGRLGSVSANR